MESDDGKRSPRHLAQLPVTVTAGKTMEHRQTAEVSLRGVFVVADVPRPQRQLVNLSISLPDGTVFDVQGIVARSVTPNEAQAQGIPPGMAVQFYGLSKHASERWESFLELARARENAGHPPFGVDKRIPVRGDGAVSTAPQVPGGLPGAAMVYVPPPPPPRGSTLQEKGDVKKGVPQPPPKITPKLPDDRPSQGLYGRPGQALTEAVETPIPGPPTRREIPPASMGEDIKTVTSAPILSDAEPDRTSEIEVPPGMMGGTAEGERDRTEEISSEVASTGAEFSASPDLQPPPAADDLDEEPATARQASLKPVKRPPAPKAPLPFEPFVEPEIPTLVNTIPADDTGTFDDDEEPPTQERPIPSRFEPTVEEPADAASATGRDMTDDFYNRVGEIVHDELHRFDEEEEERTIRSVNPIRIVHEEDTEQEPVTAQLPDWRKEASTQQPDQRVDYRSAEADREEEPTEQEVYIEPSDQATAPESSAPVSWPDPATSQPLAPDATSGAVVYRLALATIEALEGFIDTALKARGVFVKTADIRPPGTSAVVCVVHPLSNDEFHFPGEVVPLRKPRPGVAVELKGVTTRTLVDFSQFVSQGIPEGHPMADATVDHPFFGGEAEELTAVKPFDGPNDALDQSDLRENTLDVNAADLVALTGESYVYEESDMTDDGTSELPDLFPHDDQ